MLKAWLAFEEKGGYVEVKNRATLEKEDPRPGNEAIIQEFGVNPDAVEVPVGRLSGQCRVSSFVSYRKLICEKREIPLQTVLIVRKTSGNPGMFDARLELIEYARKIKPLPENLP